jgi:hypothetical protein
MAGSNRRNQVKEDSTRMGSWVVRAGLARPEFLIASYTEHLGAQGTYGFSVQYNPGSSVDDLAFVGRFANGSISYQDEDVLQAAVAPLGYRLADSVRGCLYFVPLADPYL